MMKKNLFAAALACAIAFGGFALSAADTTHELTVTMSVALKDHLTSAAPDANYSFGYRMASGGFQSLNSVLATAPTTGDSIKISLGDGFADKDGIQFGYATDAAGSGFTPANVKVSSDPLFSYNYNPASFYEYDFSKDPFDGNIEVLNFGTPLPSSTVTLLIALAAAAGLLLYNNRRQRVRSSEV